jgi:hypothetical protein
LMESGSSLPDGHVSFCYYKHTEYSCCMRVFISDDERILSYPRNHVQGHMSLLIVDCMSLLIASLC